MKNRKILSTTFSVLKGLIFIATLYYIWIKINGSNDFRNFFREFSEMDIFGSFLIILVFFGMLINWGLETAKWKYLISKFENISFFRAFRAVWSGITINNWIPNRLAEFLGRILYIRTENRTKAIFSTLIGNMAQMIMTTLWGSLGLLIWLCFEDRSGFMIMTILLVGLNVTLIYFYFHIKIAHKLISKFKFLHFIAEYSNIISSYSLIELSAILGLSFIRYFVYLTQYFLLFKAFGIEANGILLLSSAAMIFLIQVVLPSFTLSEIGIRGATVLYVAGNFSANINGLLAAAYSLWLINIIIPTLFGAFFVLGLKLKNTAKTI